MADDVGQYGADVGVDNVYNDVFAVEAVIVVHRPLTVVFWSFGAVPL